SLRKSEYEADPEHLRAIFIIGHVPVPYSGDLNTDGHPDHKGAWPSDIFYGDFYGNFTDIYVNDPGASRPENQNIPGDGKFDQSMIPGMVDLEVGRVDMHDLPAFSLSEGELLRRYLNKDHHYRNKLFTAIPRGLIDDNFGYFNGEAFASSGWRNFAPLIGRSAIHELDFFTTLSQESYLWSYGCGGGWYQGAGGVGSTTDFANDTVKSVFTMLFGSYFGDWDSQDNFLRAPLASAGYALTCCWAGRPHWQFHHMAMGENIGYCTKLSQNNNATYWYNYGRHSVHIALMGDPTLREHVIAPVSNVNVTTQYSMATITWQASLDTVLGYYVYRSAEEFGNYSRISDSIINGLTFHDPTPLQGDNFYMVRALKLEKTPSGSYYNLSTGVMNSVFVILGNNDAQRISTNIFTIYPNPAKDHIDIKFSREVQGEVSVVLTDLAGRELTQQQLLNLRKDQPYSVNLKGISSGVYFITIQIGNIKLTRKVEVIR
ncbi:MAG: T9SS type A sorting domain-containing protein, partial [Bacteroidota bacterium]